MQGQGSMDLSNLKKLRRAKRLKMDVESNGQEAIMLQSKLSLVGANLGATDTWFQHAE